MADCGTPMTPGCGYDIGMHWIGYPAALIPFADHGSTQVTDNFDPQIQTGMGGKRRVRVSRERASRSWKINVPAARADDVSHLRSLITSTMGPYQLVTAEAQVSNVLTPEQATLQSVGYPLGGLALAGWRPIVDERLSSPGALARVNPGAMFSNEAPVTLIGIPTPPVWTQRKVTMSCHLATARPEGAMITIRWVNSAGQTITTKGSNSVTGMNGLRRVTVTGVPPSGTVSATMVIRYAEIIAQPQVTWTDEAIPEWAMGNGADRVVISGFDRDSRWSMPDDAGWRRGDYSLDLEEALP